MNYLDDQNKTEHEQTPSAAASRSVRKWCPGDPEVWALGGLVSPASAPTLPCLCLQLPSLAFLCVKIPTWPWGLDTASSAHLGKLLGSRLQAGGGACSGPLCWTLCLPEVVLLSIFFGGGY